MDLVAASIKEEKGQHVHGWENVTPVDIRATAVLKNKLASVYCDLTSILCQLDSIPNSLFKSIL